MQYFTWKLEVASDILSMVVGKNENEKNDASNHLNFVFAFEHLQKPFDCLKTCSGGL